VLFGSYDSYLYKLDAATGALKWKFETENYVHCAPCEAAGLVMIAGCDGVMRMISLATGKQQRVAELGGNFAGAPAYGSGCVFVGSMDGTYYSVRLSDAKIMWQRQEARQGAAIFASAAVVEDAVIFASRSNAVFRVNRDTGKEIWSFRTRGDVNSSPVVNGGDVFFGSADGNLYRVRLADGVKTWQFSAGAGISASPAIGQRRLVIGAEDGAVYCFG